MKYIITFFLMSLFCLKAKGSLDTVRLAGYKVVTKDSGILDGNYYNYDHSEFRAYPCGGSSYRIHLNILTFDSTASRIFIYRGQKAIASNLLVPEDGISKANKDDWDDTTLDFSADGFCVVSYMGQNQTHSFYLGWKTTKYDTLKPLGVQIKTTKSIEYNGTYASFVADITNAGGLPAYEWKLDGNGSMSFLSEFNYVLTTDGSYTICLHAEVCGRKDSTCSVISVITPTKKVDLSLGVEAIYPLEPKIVRLRAISEQAGSFQWSISPPTYFYLNGTNGYSQNPQIQFNKDTCYSVQLVAWNNVGGKSLTENSILVSDFYCNRKILKPLTIGSFDVNLEMYFDLDSNGNFDSTDIPARNNPVNMGFKKSYLQMLTDREGKLEINLADTTFVNPYLPKNTKFKNSSNSAITWTPSLGSMNYSIGLVITSFDSLPDISTIIAPGFLQKGRTNVPVIYIGNGRFNAVDSVICLFKSDRKLLDLQALDGSYTRIISNTDTTVQFHVKYPFYYGSYMYFTPIAFTTASTDTGESLLSCACFALNNIRDKDSSDNYTETKMKIVFPHDPNDIAVDPMDTFRKRVTEFTYKIRFQNTGTAVAQDVIISDTLDGLLDPESVELTSTSHKGYLVRKDNILSFEFHGINLPDSGYNEELSHGFVVFRVKTKSDIPSKKPIPNKAFIYFDFENAVITNTTSNVYIPVPELYFAKGKHMSTTACSPFPDPIPVASDDLDGNITGNISKAGIYRNNRLIEDSIFYSITNSTGITVSALYTISKTDTLKPHIRLQGNNITDQMNVLVIQHSVFKDQVYSYDSCITPPLLQIQPGLNGPVNTVLAGTYPIRYFAQDSSNNMAVENGFTINYIVQPDTNIRVKTFEESDFMIWPNPADKLIYVQYSGKENPELTLYSPQGQIVPILITAERSIYTINTSEIPGGFFVLRACTSAGCLEKQIVIVR